MPVNGRPNGRSIHGMSDALPDARRPQRTAYVFTRQSLRVLHLGKTWRRGCSVPPRGTFSARKVLTLPGGTGCWRIMQRAGPGCSREAPGFPTILQDAIAANS